MSREEALKRIEKPEMIEEFLKQEFEYVAVKLGLEYSELMEIYNRKNKTYKDYRDKKSLIGFGANMMTLLGLEKRLFR